MVLVLAQLFLASVELSRAAQRPRTPSVWTELCALPSPHANDGTMKIRRSLLPPPVGGDLREVVLDWTTNQMHCSGGGGGGALFPGSQCGGVTTPTRAPTRSNLTACRPCPCTPEYRLPTKGSKSPVVSDYAVEMCNSVVTTFKCAFRRAVVVGLGTGLLSGCLAFHCPNMVTTTVDIDQNVLALAEAYFGWRNQTVVYMGGAESFFRAAADRGDQYDLVLFDCFSRHVIPAGCRTPLLLASVRRVLQRTHVGGPTLFAVNMFGASLAYRQNFTSLVRRSGAVEAMRGQWLSFTQA